MTKELVTLEQNKKFSQSLLWQLQRDYYDSEGIDAWKSNVPFYITSNPFIGKCYARLTVRFIQDWLRQHPDAKQHPFYMIELGTGPGQFSFYVLQHLQYLKEMLGMQDIEIVYVMTDFTKSNVEFWQQHEQLKPFVDCGLLDFAVYDVENDDTITLTEKGSVLRAKALHNPMIVFANYLFDSIINDIFLIKDNQIKESRITLKTPADNLENGQPKAGDKLTIEYEDHALDGGYYADARFNDLLDECRREFDETRILFPIGSLRTISHLQSFSDGKLLLISSDKGSAFDDEIDDCLEPELDYHGSFSVMVNYNAISRYFKANGGDSFMQNQRDAIISTAFGFGFKFDEMKELNLALELLVSDFSPADYFNFYEHLDSNYKKCDLDMLASFLNLSGWDPGVFDVIDGRISDLLEDAEQEIIDYLSDNLHKVVENFYYIPEANDTIFDVGVFYQEIEEYEKALKYFDLSRRYFAAEWEVLFNSGFCAHELQRYDEALKFFEQAHEVDPKDKETRQFIENTKRKLATV
ncbi:MAG: tetratricopeptide repeat protein [Gammaproteobacteria bacterium]|nr:tetratricopeptide repeat protein [Gammaproteobacteria bacterium]MCH9744829.1 tetratricopeptide repeat protein [Gammaproteobacteria bacterium]